MARLIGPDEASREVKAIVGNTFVAKRNRPAQLWADAAATVPADVMWPDGTTIPTAQPDPARPLGPTVTIDSSSMLPLFQFPPGDVDVVYATCDGGPVWPVYVRTDDRFDGLANELADVRLVPTEINPLERGAAADYTGRFGAAGTGTDSRAGIQAALDAASDINDPSYYGYLSRRSTTVRLPPGQYLISAPSSGPSLNVPPGVDFDHSAATLYFDYPPAARSDWCAIQINQYAQSRVGKVYTSGRTSAPDSALTYDAVRLVMTDNNSRVVGYGDSEIRGFQGAGVRLVGAWISFIRGIRFTGLKYGLVASNRGDGTLGYPLPAGNPSGSRRVVTDLYVEDCQFVNCTHGGLVGAVTGAAPDVNAIDNSDSGLVVALKNCVFESIGTYGLRVNNALTVSMIDCGLEETGTTEAMAWLDNVRSFVGVNVRVNLAGRTVPGPAGNVQPFPGAVYKVTSVQSFTLDGLYCHNTLNTALTLATGAASSSYRVGGTFADSHPIAAGPMYAGQGVASLSATWNKGRLALGSRHLWVDANGTLRHRSGTPTSDVDGVALAAANLYAIPLASGLYYATGTGQITTSQLTEGSELAVPFVAGRTTALAEIAASVTAAGSAGALLRFGIRADNNGQPGALLIDAGTVAATSTGIKSSAIAPPLVEGTLYWATVTGQGAATTRPTIQAVSGVHDPRIGHASASTLLSMAAGLHQSGAATTPGALPSAQPAWSAASTVPRIAVRAS